MEKVLTEEEHKNTRKELLVQLIEFIPTYVASKFNFSKEYQEQCFSLVEVLKKILELDIIPTIGHIERLKILVMKARKEDIFLERKEFHKLINNSNT